MREYKLIIFDLDDTLFDYRKTEEHAVVKACENLGVIFSGKLYSQYLKANKTARVEYKAITPNNIQKFRDSRANIFLSLINNDQINPVDFLDEYLKYSKVGVLIDGVEDTLKSLEGIVKVVATNGSNYPRQNKLENSRIAKYFDAYFSSENLGISKPAPEYFLDILKHYDVFLSNVLIVGDDYFTDVLGAINLGIDCCWFNHRNKNIDVELPANIYVITHFSEIIDMVMRGKHE